MGGGGAGLASWDEIPIFPQNHFGQLPNDNGNKTYVSSPKDLDHELGALEDNLDRSKNQRKH